MTVSTSIVSTRTYKRPRAPMRATVARLIFERAVAGIPSGSPIPAAGCSGAGSPTSPEFQVIRPAAFFAGSAGREDRIR